MSQFKIRVLCAAFAAGLLGSLAASPALAAAKDSRVIVKFKAGAFAKGRAAVAAQGGRVLVNLSEVDAIATRLSPAAVKVLKRSRFVEFVEPDHLQYPMAVKRTRAAALAETVPYGIPMVQADMVSDSAAGNRTLCIIDSGIDGTHPDHAGNVLSGENFTTSGTWDSDENDHGTHVAGTVAAVGGNGIGVVGVLPSKTLKLYIAKVFDASGSTSSSTVAKAMLACHKNGGANVISMSLGGAGQSRLQAVVAKLLDKRGVMMFAAAGNGGSSAVSYPAGLPEVISVAAVDSSMARASFSQFNPDVEIAAPGVGVLSTVPVASVQSGSLDVGGTPFAVIAGSGSATGSATAPLYNFGFGGAVDAGAAGKVCLISRGNDITFGVKVDNCVASGGVGAVVYNNVPGPLAMDLGGSKSIVAVGADGNDAAALLAKVGQSATASVVPSDYPYAAFNGTSMATPHASAVAALVWSQHPACTAAQMRISLNNSAMDLGAGGRDNEFGFGLIQAKTASDRITSLGCGV
jgi:subtilisin family serine protease